MQKFILPLVLLFFCFVLVSNSVSQELADSLVLPSLEKEPEKKVVPLPIAANKFRKEFAFKLRRGTAVRKDYDKCFQGLQSLQLDEHKQPFYLLMAQYHRSIDRAPVKALGVLAPLIVLPEVAEKWTNEQLAAAQSAFDSWKIEYEAAKNAKKKKDDIPERPEGLFVEFPAVETWRLNDDTAFVCIEIARNLAILNRQEEAFNVIDAVGSNCDQEYMILAAECAADMMAWIKMYDNALEFYSFSLQIFRAIKENGDEHTILSEDDQRQIKNRIYYKAGAIRRLAEQGRFTPDWLAYREAQRKHLDEESLLEAIWMYLDVAKEYPDTICGEASECYLIKVLCHLSNPAFIKEAAKRYDIILNQLEDAKAQLRDAKRTGVAPPFRVGLEAYVDRLAYCVKMFEKTPMGRKALEQAEERAERFIEKNKYGLYRGEVMLDIGKGYLNSFCDVANGRKWLDSASVWFENAPAFDKELREFELPNQLRVLTMPPKTERYKDAWTNIRMSKPKPGDYFNRRTCSWYLDSKHKEVALLQGLICYADGNLEQARSYWNKLTILDSDFYAELKNEGKSSYATHSRLIWNIENNKTSLYATPSEMQVFDTHELRLAVLLADLDMENESYKEAEFKYRHLLEIGDIKRRPDRASYIAYALGMSQMMQFKVEESIKCFRLFAPGAVFSDAEICPKALNVYANYMVQSTSHPENFTRGVQCYTYITKTYPNTDFGKNAIFFLARCYDRCGEQTRAKELYRHYLSQNPKGEYARHAIKGTQ